MSLSNFEFNPQGIAETLIRGQAGDMETLITRPDAFTATTPIAVICHPNSLHGGSMSNKVVHILAKTFAEMGAMTVRFNFRGVGQSAGVFDQGIGESEDLIALVSQLRLWQPTSPIWLAGFSFGAYVSARSVAELKPEKLLLIAPPVSMHEFDQLPEITIPWVVIQGGQDEVIEAGAVKQWLDAQANPPRLIWMDDATHFFHGKLNEVKAALLKAWID